MRRRDKKGRKHRRRCIGRVGEGERYTRDKGVRFGTVDSNECSKCPGVADTQEHRVLECQGGNKEDRTKGRKAWTSLDDLSTFNIPERGCTAVKRPPPPGYCPKW